MSATAPALEPGTRNTPGMSRPAPVLLSLAIPTHDRAAYLRECLESIAVSLRESGRAGQCEVVVSDNASSDDTPEVLREWAAIMGLRAVRQAVNIGAHANFRAVAEMATGPFVWIIGDDDRLAPGAIRKVLAGLEGGARTVICNVSVHSRDFKRIIKDRFLPMEKDELYHDPSRLLARLGTHTGYISAMVLDRAAFLSVPAEMYRRFDTGGSCFMYAAYHVIAGALPVLCLAEPLVLNRGDESELRNLAGGGSVPAWQSLARWNMTFVEGFPRALQALRAIGYSARSIHDAQVKQVFWFVLPRLLGLKANGLPVRGLVGSAMRHMPSVWAVWLLVLPLSFLPGRILRGLKPAKRLWMRWFDDQPREGTEPECATGRRV